MINSPRAAYRSGRPSERLETVAQPSNSRSSLFMSCQGFWQRQPSSESRLRSKATVYSAQKSEDQASTAQVIGAQCVREPQTSSGADLPLAARMADSNAPQ